MLSDLLANAKKLQFLKVFAIVFILALAFLLRTHALGEHDLIGDEAAYAFRSVGFIDYLGTSFQTQPIEWYKDKELPLWTKLSFHDHPPLGFFVQHIFFNIFGDSATTARLPAAVFGTLSVLLVYAITRRLFSETAGIAAAFLFAISGASVTIFRTSLLEPTLLFLILTNIYLFLRFAEDSLFRRRYWWLAGSTLGLIFLTKYTGAFLLPLYATYLLLFFRDVYRDSRLYAAFFAALTLLAPVVIYNIMLFKTTGHFDLQISYFLGQETPEWTGLLGKTESVFSDIFKNWFGLFGLATTILVSLGAIQSIVLLGRQEKKAVVFLWLYAFLATLLFIFTGAAERFLVLYIPAAVIFAALGIAWLWQYKKDSLLYPLFVLCLIVLLSSELIFAIHKNFIQYQDFGIARLDRYFEQEFKGKESAVVPEADNPHITDIIRDFVAREESGTEPLYAVIIYNDNVTLGTLQWIFERRFFYESIPTFYVENWNLSRAGNLEFLKGFKAYFVQSTPYTLQNEFKRGKTAALEFEMSLLKRGIKPDTVIYNKDGLPTFKIYTFIL